MQGDHFRRAHPVQSGRGSHPQGNIVRPPTGSVAIVVPGLGARNLRHPRQDIVDGEAVAVAPVHGDTAHIVGKPGGLRHGVDDERARRVVLVQVTPSGCPRPRLPVGISGTVQGDGRPGGGCLRTPMVGGDGRASGRQGEGDAGGPAAGVCTVRPGLGGGHVHQLPVAEGTSCRPRLIFISRCAHQEPSGGRILGHFHRGRDCVHSHGVVHPIHGDHPARPTDLGEGEGIGARLIQLDGGEGNLPGWGVPDSGRPLALG